MASRDPASTSELAARPWRGALRVLIAASLVAAAPSAEATGSPGAASPAASPAAGAAATGAVDPHEIKIDVHSFQVVHDDSGPVNYYTVVDDPEGSSYIRSAYTPPTETAVLGWAVPENLRHSVVRIRWRWRALTLPNGGNECESGKNDSAAVVYLTFRRWARYYGLKYVWSTVGPRGATCDERRNLFRSQDTIIGESGGPTGQWRTVVVYPGAEFRKHFDAGKTAPDPPEFLGIGIMSDGDQTQSPSAADFGGFEITVR